LKKGAKPTLLDLCLLPTVIAARSSIIFVGQGADAALNVMGSSDSDAQFGPGEQWIAEIKPVSIVNVGPALLTRTIVIPLRHNYTEFFLSKSLKSAVPDIGVPIGGSVLVFAIGVSCLAGTPG
jgi:hypothetical protein